MNILYNHSFLCYWEWFLLFNQYVYIDIDYYIFLSIDCIDIYSYILYWLEWLQYSYKYLQYDNSIVISI